MGMGIAAAFAFAVMALEDLASGATACGLAATAAGALTQDVLHAALVGFGAGGGGFGVVLLGAVARGWLDAIADCGGVEGPDESLFGFVARVGVGDLVEGLFDEGGLLVRGFL